MYVSINESSDKFYEQNQKSENTDYDLHFTHINKYFFHNAGPLLQTHSQVVCIPSLMYCNIKIFFIPRYFKNFRDKERDGHFAFYKGYSRVTCL